MTKMVFTDKMLIAVHAVKDNLDKSYYEIDDMLGLRRGTTGNRMQSVRELIKRSQGVVNQANAWKKAHPRLRKTLI